jgi:hypothetical protein
MDTSKLPKLPLSQPLPSSPDIPLHDIKPLVEIDDYSIYYFSGIIILIIAILVALAFFGWRYWSKRNAFSIRKKHSKLLHEIDFSNPKEAAYAITKYGYTFSNDDERHHEKYENLLSRLAPYKYKKEVEAIDSETKSYFEIYLGMIDV